MNKLFGYIKEPKRIILYLMNKNLLNWMPDAPYLKLKYYLYMGKKLNLNEPKSFNEKLQWLKINDRKIIYTKMVDKYEAKKYVANIIGEEYIIPTLGIYNSFEEINFDKLPNQFVIKCTHDSGGIEIVRDKFKMDKERVRKKINKFMKRNYFKVHREWPYKNIKPRIIVEKYMKDENDKLMKDYKFFSFGGKPEIMFISERQENHVTAGMTFFDMNFNLSDCERRDFRRLNYIPKKPITFEKMKNFAGILSKGIPHVRVDFYEINGELYFGELTFFTHTGMIPFKDEIWDRKLGDMIDLSLSRNDEIFCN